MSSSSASTVVEALGGGPVGRSVAQSSGGGGDRVPPAAVTGEHLVGGTAGETVLLGVGERVLLHLQRGVLVRVVDGGGVELGDLEPGEVELAGAGPLVAAERGQLGVELGQPGARRAQRGEVDAGEGVERPPLRRRRQQLLVGVLAVQVDQLACGIGERRDRGRTPVDVGARPAGRRHDPGEHDLASRRRRSGRRRAPRRPRGARWWARRDHRPPARAPRRASSCRRRSRR